MRILVGSVDKFQEPHHLISHKQQRRSLDVVIEQDDLQGELISDGVVQPILDFGNVPIQYCQSGGLLERGRDEGVRAFRTF